MIRLALMNDYKEIASALSSMDSIDYLTSSHVLKDIQNKNCYVLEDAERIVAIGSVVYDNDFKMHYIKRLAVLDQNSRGKGYGKRIMRYLADTKPVIATTPFDDNVIMKKMIKPMGFEYKYTFLNKYQLFVKGM